MNKLENMMLAHLLKLKNHNISAVKISFEDEWLTGELAQIITSISMRAGVDVAIKIGGCEARRDLHDAKVLGAAKVVAPMIETPYSLKKFVEAVNIIYPIQEWHDTKFVINIETMTGFKNLIEMMNQEESKIISWITLWRVDFSWSIWQDRSYCNSDEMLEIAKNICEICRSNNKSFCLWWAISDKAINFMHSLPIDVFNTFETRNIVFDAKKALEDEKLDDALITAMEFELAWMQRKHEFYDRIANAEISRIEMITKRVEAAKNASLS